MTKTFFKVLKYLGKCRFAILASALTAALSVICTLYIPILIGDAIDLIVDSCRVDFGGISPLLITAIILIAISAVLQWVMAAINNRICYKVVKDMRHDAFSKIEGLPLSYIDSHPHGDTVNRVINDTERFGEGLLLGATQVFTGLLTIIGTIAFMFAINFKIAIVVVLLTPLSIVIAKFIGGRTYHMFTLRSKTEAEETSYINEILSNEKTVLAFSHESAAVGKFNEINERLRGTTLRAIFFSSLTNPTTRFINSMVYAMTALVGAILVISTAGAALPFTVGQFTCLLSYTNQYTKPFNEISGIIAEFQNALASAGRVIELIETESEKPDCENAEELVSPSGNVRFEDVSFSYTEDKPLIEGLNIDVKSGERIAIVGPTGAGKTTLINLLMRFYDTTDGSIKIDGRDIKTLTRKSLRSGFGMVLQDTWLMSGTVKENIAYGKRDATDEEIISAAKTAHAHGFIKRLKNGYDTLIGEGGEELSAGQRQLICIARVMLCLPPMLILDEATSNIDTRTEMKIQEAFSKMMAGRTSFIVAHRLSTIADADLILVMKDGKIVETGTHAELLSLSGFYKYLYDCRTAGTEES